MSSQVLGEKHEFKTKPSQERLQNKPNRLKTEDPTKICDPRRSTKRSVRGARALNWAGAFTTAHGGGGTTMLFGTHGHVAFPAPVLHFPSCPFVFPRDFSICVAFLALKGGCIWPYWGFRYFFSLSNAIEE